MSEPTLSRIQRRRAVPLMAALLSASCAGDPSTPTRATFVGPHVEAAIASATCSDCLWGPQTVKRAAGASDTTWHFTITAVPGSGYLLMLDGNLGGRGVVRLNGVEVLADDSYRRDSLVVTLADANTLDVTLGGSRDRSMTLTLRARPPITLDNVSLTGPSTLVIDGPGTSYDALISNRTRIARTNLDTQGWILQPSAGKLV